jgi:hypothetical protein
VRGLIKILGFVVLAYMILSVITMFRPKKKK